MGDVQPVRLRLSRAKGFNLKAHSLATNGLLVTNVARPTMWGNFAAVRAGTPTGILAVEAFRAWVADEASEAWKGRVERELRGRNLACWCALSAPCHADVLLELANHPSQRVEDQGLSGEAGRMPSAPRARLTVEPLRVSPASAASPDLRTLTNDRS